MVPIVQNQPSWPQNQPNLEAKHCQERIQCLEKALSFMQTELDRLQQDSNNNINNLEDKYDKITVLPCKMIVDWVNGNWRPKPGPRSDSFRAKSVAPSFLKQGLPYGAQSGDHRATSAPPAPPRPFPRR